MAAKRKASYKKYLIAFVLTLLVFSGGILVGIFLEDARLNYSQQVTLSEKVNLRSLQLQQNYIDLGLADCNTLHKILDHNINELTKKMGIIMDYQKKSVFNQEEFDLQLQDYFLTEIQFYLLSQEIDNKCKEDSIKILYFYDENRYDTQGDILSYLKKRFGSKILVFSLNSGFKQEPMINILLTSFDITKFPSIVVDGEVYHEHKGLKELMLILCDKFVEKGIEQPKECKIIN